MHTLENKLVEPEPELQVEPNISSWAKQTPVQPTKILNFYFKSLLLIVH
jgi:hypothetical protein